MHHIQSSDRQTTLVCRWIFGTDLLPIPTFKQIADPHINPWIYLQPSYYGIRLVIMALSLNASLIRHNWYVLFRSHDCKHSKCYIYGFDVIVCFIVCFLLSFLDYLLVVFINRHKNAHLYYTKQEIY